MPIPNVNFTILSNGLGNVAASPAGTVAVFGCSSAGTVNSPTGEYLTPGDCTTDFGYGPGTDLVENLVSSGVPVVFTKVTTNIVGVASAVTPSGTGTAVLTVTGTPLDAYNIIVTTTLAGTAGSDPEPGFTISFDGGETATRQIRMPASRSYTGFAASTGLTFTWSAGTMVVNDTSSLTTTGPTWAAADVAAAIDSYRTSNFQAALLYVPGAAAKSDATIITAAANNLINQKKFDRLLIEARDIAATGETEAQWMTALSADYATFETNLVVVGAGAALVVSRISGTNYRRNIGWLAILRAALVKPGRDIGAVLDGALVPFQTNGQGVAVSTVYHNEGLVPGLDADRFMTVTSFNGKTGFYITNPNIMCGPTSDFTLLQYGRVMDEACRVANGFFTDRLSTDVRLNRRTGRILDKDATALESGCNTALQAALVNTGNVSDITTIVSRVDNISVTKTLTVTISILPLGYLKRINVTMTFVNPALGAAA